jgi:hypothetical protein
MSSTLAPPAAGLTEGERRRAAALALLRDHRAVVTWLVDHPELPEVDQGEPKQRSFWS